jgi:hypothetical protein
MYMAYTIAGQNNRAQSVDETRLKKNRKVNAVPVADDGFDFIRKKKHLQNRADKIVAGDKREE